MSERDVCDIFRDMFCDVTEVLDEFESRYIELRDDLQEKIKDFEERKKEFLKTYEEGLAKGEQSMQEKAKKIVDFWNEAEDEEIEDVFSDMEDGSAFESINESYDKIIEYEKKEKEIKVGDEVVDCDGIKYVVRFLNDCSVYALAYNGASVEFDYADVSKTGKHYPLDEMLKELK